MIAVAVDRGGPYAEVCVINTAAVTHGSWPGKVATMDG